MQKKVDVLVSLAFFESYARVRNAQYKSQYKRRVFESKDASVGKRRVLVPLDAE